MGDPVMWFDLGAAEDSSLKTFYPEMFGWTLQPTSERYTVLLTGGGAMGGIGRSQTGEPWLTFYVEVADLQATLDRVAALGGSVVVPVSEVPGMLRWAMFTDPDGLLIGLTSAMAGDDAAPIGAGVPVDWFEVLGSDAARSQAFYGELFGWTYEQAGPTYGLANTLPGRGIPGGVGSSGDGSMWATVYVKVDDVERSLAKAVALGGSRAYGPHDVDDHMQSGAIRDPAGNLFGVYHHTPH